MLGGQWLIDDGPGSLLKSSIPLKAWHEWSDITPGFIEIDMVSHDRGDNSRRPDHDGTFLTIQPTACGATRRDEPDVEQPRQGARAIKLGGSYLTMVAYGLGQTYAARRAVHEVV